MSAEHPFAQFRFCPKCGSPKFVVNNEKSKHCEQCGFTYYFNPSAATVAVIINEQGQLLVCRRSKEPSKGTLDLCGGFCDCYETSEEGVIREVKEESGLDVVSTEYMFSIPNTYVYSDFTVHTIDNFFKCKVNSIHKAQAADDAEELMWLSPQDIYPEDFGLNSIRKGIEKILKEKLL